MNHHHSRTGLEIAVIGMAGRFPGAQNINQFWENLKNGVEAVTFYSDEELTAAGVDPGLLKNPNYVNSGGGVLDDKEYFDASFFGYSAVEAQMMDPQLRVFHQCAWHALEDAGYAPFSFEGPIGLYAGASFNPAWETLSFLSGKVDVLGDFATGLVIDRDYLCTQVSYHLNLKGPSVVVKTACSTSLVAVHMACQSILSGECDLALAGGVTITQLMKSGYLYQEDMIASPDGHCRAFDHRAKGTVNGEGVGIVVLKRLEEAAADRDHIYAVVKGIAINNDGMRKVGYTAPSIVGQSDVICDALQVAGVEPETVTYVEAHGTGTTMGDPIEIEALKMAFNTDKKRFCRIGSVKNNIGHLDSAAGAAGLIKTILALKYKLIPPSLHFEEPNPKIDFENSPFYVNTDLTEWDCDGYPLRASVSSFGIGGTNAHAILEEAPEIETSSQGRPWKLLLLSAKTAAALDRMTENLADYFKKNSGINLADAAYTLQVGRGAFKYRRMLTCSTIDNAIDALSSPNPVKVKTAQVKEEETPVIFMFPGLGSQYVNMGLDLYQSEPVFREEMDRCFEIMNALADYDIKEILYPGSLDSPPDSALNHIEIAQVAIFIIEYALARLLITWGIKPHAMIGYSFGEYTAACISGVLFLEDALKLILLRGKLTKKLPEGAMLSVPITREELKPFLNLHGELSLAIDNGPSCIAAGPKDAVDAFEEEIKKNGHMCVRLQASRAIHSKMMEPILKEFEAVVGQVVLNQPQIPYISNVTGDWIKVKEAVSPIYWATHLRETVQFADGIKKLVQEKNAVFMEIGPGRDLNALITRFLDNSSQQRVVTIVRHPSKNVSDVFFLLNKIGRAWLLGMDINWDAFYSHEERYRLALPTYPFDRQGYRIEGDTIKLGLKKFTELDQSRRKSDIADWFYIPSWKRLKLSSDKIGEMPGQACWLLFIDAFGLGAQLAKQLEKKGQVVITVERGAAFLKQREHQFSINPHQDNGKHYDALFNQLRQQDMIPDRIVHLWGITGNHKKGAEIEIAEEAQDLGFYSLIYIAGAIGKQLFDKKTQIKVITNNMHDIIGDEECNPAKATVLGPVRVIPIEYTNISCCSIDVVIDNPGIIQKGELIDQLLDEFCAESVDPIVAFRANHRWVQSFEPTRLEEAGKNKGRLGQEGVYLIIGGLGYLGLTLAQYLASNVKKVKLVLTGRSQFPPKSQWEQYLNNSPGNHAIKQKILEMQKLEKSGAEILVFSADVSNRQQMDKMISEAENRFGQITGVIHCAGDLDSCLIQNKTRAAAEKNLAAKVKGTPVLYEIFKNTKLDFFVLFSSLRSFLPALGTVGQVAASNFFDYFANYYSKRADFPVISINWDGWYKPDLTANAGRSTGSIVPHKGTEAFRRVLEDRFSQVAVSASDLGRKIQLTRNWAESEDTAVTKDNDSREKSLNENVYQRPQLDTQYTAPRNQTEKVLADIWAVFFGFENVGIHDDFFDLGGHSFSATQVVFRANQAGLSLTLKQLFQHPTIAELSAVVNFSDTAGSSTWLEEEMRIPNDGSLTEIVPISRDGNIPLSFSQERCRMYQMANPGITYYNLSHWVQIKGKLDINILRQSFNEILRRHDILRTTFPEKNNTPFQMIMDQQEMDIAVTDLQNLHGPERTRELEKRINEEMERPFDLVHGPLMRVTLVKPEEETHVLGLLMHHMIVDFYSMIILAREFSIIYEAFLSGKPCPLPGLTLQYADFASWQHRYFTREILEDRLHYWEQWLAEGPPRLELPGDRPRPRVETYRGGTKRGQYSPDLVREIKKLAKQSGTSFFLTIMAAFMTSLYHYSGYEDLVVAFPILNRNNQVKTVIGMFTTTLLLRIDMGGNPSFRELLDRVQRESFSASKKQDVPFEHLIKTLRPGWDLSTKPSYRVLLNTAPYYAEPTLGIAGLDITPLTGNVGDDSVMRHDLSLDIEQEKIPAGTKLYVLWRYKKDLFDAETIDRLADHFRFILEEMVKNPGQGVEDFIKDRSLEYQIKKTNYESAANIS